MSNIDESWKNFRYNDSDEEYDSGGDYSSDIGEIQKSDHNSYEDSVKFNTPLQISTMTKILYLNNIKNININELFWKLPILNYNIFGEGIVKKQIKINTKNKEETEMIQQQYDAYKEEKQYNDIYQQIIKVQTYQETYKHQQIICVGVSNKNIKEKNKKETKAFFNCIALFIRIKHENVFKEIHIKIFNTGKIEIPGIKSNEFLYKTLNYMINLLNNICAKYPQLNIIKTNEKNNIVKYNKNSIKNILINSTFNCGYLISRENLFDKLIYKYNMVATLDICRYAGIRCAFYYNENKEQQDGICNCSDINDKSSKPISDLKKCTKKGTGKGIGQCKKIAIMIFRTGSVMIVGNCNENVLNIIYNYINKILIDEYPNINNGVISEYKTKIVQKSKYTNYTINNIL
jgi:TATA-box binding protein (TBP) (component of TFIID and TFIIIB)